MSEQVVDVDMDLKASAPMMPETHRPWLTKDKHCRSMVTIDGKDRPSEVKAILFKDEWDELDKVVERVFWTACPTVKALLDFGLRLDIDGMKNTIVEDRVEMPETESGPLFKLTFLPLPFTYADFECDLRKLYRSRALMQGMDTFDCESAVRMTAEKVEETVLGDTPDGPIGYGGTCKVYGIFNHPDRLTVLSDPEARLKSAGFYGPYFGIGSKEVRGKTAVVQATAEVIRIVVGLMPTVIQHNDGFRMVCILVHQIRLGNGIAVVQ